ncbi:MAG: hypothetical protein AB1791_01780 [Chloroflexota bacterium]
MAFTVGEYNDLIQLLNTHPEWRGQLRNLLIADDLAEIRAIQRETNEIYRRIMQRQESVEQRLTRLEQAVQALVEGQKQTEAHLKRLDALLQQQGALLQQHDERLARMDEHLAHIDTLLQQHSEHMARIDGHLQKHDDQLGDMRGWILEAKYRERAPSYFGRYLRRGRVVRPTDLDKIDQAYTNRQLSEKEWESLMALDVLLRGISRQEEATRELFVALEVSTTIDSSDVEWAHERAGIMQKLGYLAVGAVGGLGILAEANQQAQKLGIVVALDGHVQEWPRYAPLL